MAARFRCCTFASPLLVVLGCHTAPLPRPLVGAPIVPLPAQAPAPPSDPSPDPPDFQPPPPPVQVLANPPVPVQDKPDEASWTVVRVKNGCLAAIDVSCPTGEPGKPMEICHPMPAFRVACPAGLQLGHRTKVTFGDSCTADLEPIHCPPGGPCTPPRPVSIPCPKP